MDKRKYRAVVERYKPFKVGDISTRERARLHCGCVIWVGRTGEGAAATRSQACSEGHQALAARADALLTEEQTRPVVGRPLVTVCTAVLSQAAKEIL